MYTLVKVDVASVYLGISVRKSFDLADGGSANEPGLLWVWNLAHNISGNRRDLRFLRAELVARGKGQDAEFRAMTLETVIDQVLPARREGFYGGQLDQAFQIRPRTRLDFGPELPGVRAGSGHWYRRTALAEFLKRRWLGTAILEAKAVAA